MQVALVTAGGTVAVTLIGTLVELLRRQNNAINEVRENAQEARDQVANTHSTNLRDDLDRVIDGLEAVLAGQARHDEALRQHGREIGGLRTDLAHERAERLAVAERLDGHIAVTVATNNS
ncbi:hypothetical protein PBI_PAEDORE_25 [Streptomyces phage Paedore]|uniref:DUF2746 domain-containing protein n=1 Tax=Streptomyces phage Paedore TaxID=2108134 RepID=A0A2P1JTN7_9CAUD|nr:hypothetical protein KGG91_gp25 [Streptomyces phage Paedore]AVO22508.1 hypothetical protein PBI_PAEDORE_25 [Streptomyces phage Paedore]